MLILARASKKVILTHLEPNPAPPVNVIPYIEPHMLERGRKSQKSFHIKGYLAPRKEGGPPYILGTPFSILGSPFSIPGSPFSILGSPFSILDQERREVLLFS